MERSEGSLSDVTMGKDRSPNKDKGLASIC